MIMNWDIYYSAQSGKSNCCFITGFLKLLNRMSWDHLLEISQSHVLTYFKRAKIEGRQFSYVIIPIDTTLKCDHDNKTQLLKRFKE